MKLTNHLRAYVCLRRLLTVVKLWSMSDMAFLSRVLRWFDRQHLGVQMVVLGKLTTTEFRTLAGRGDTENPSWKVVRVDQVPPSREDIRLIERVDWKEIARALNSGLAVSLCVAGYDSGLLVDMIQNRIGHNLAIRIPESGQVCFYRPHAFWESADGVANHGNTTTT